MTAIINGYITAIWLAAAHISLLGVQTQLPSCWLVIVHVCQIFILLNCLNWNKSRTRNEPAISFLISSHRFQFSCSAAHFITASALLKVSPFLFALPYALWHCGSDREAWLSSFLFFFFFFVFERMWYLFCFREVLVGLLKSDAVRALVVWSDRGWKSQVKIVGSESRASEAELPRARGAVHSCRTALPRAPLYINEVHRILAAARRRWTASSARQRRRSLGNGADSCGQKTWIHGEAETWMKRGMACTLSRQHSDKVNKILWMSSSLPVHGWQRRT